MHRNGHGPSVEWAQASIPFPTAPGLGWRRHMSKIAMEIGTVFAVRVPPRIAHLTTTGPRNSLGPSAGIETFASTRSRWSR
jgi:hypothetical protein